MNPYITGNIIRELREKNRLTQAQLAEKLCVSDKTISKWETAKGYPDITLLEPIARAFDVSVAELLSGTAVSNQNRASDMLKSKFYVCPICGNVLHSTGAAAVHCHGVMLSPCEPEPADAGHAVSIEVSEDEYRVRIDHPMAKDHTISFIAALSQNAVQLVKLYPEQPAEARFKIDGVRRVAFFCNRDGLFQSATPADNFQRKINRRGHNSVRLNDASRAVEENAKGVIQNG